MKKEIKDVYIEHWENKIRKETAKQTKEKVLEILKDSLEDLANLEHEQWLNWSKTVAVKRKAGVCVI
jgi:hypothetical protein